MEEAIPVAQLLLILYLFMLEHEVAANFLAGGCVSRTDCLLANAFLDRTHTLLIRYSCFAFMTTVFPEVGVKSD